MAALHLPETNASLALQWLQEQALQFVLVRTALLLKPWSWHISPTYGELNLIGELCPKYTWGLDKAIPGHSHASSIPQKRGTKEKVTSACQNRDGRWSSSIFLLGTCQAAQVSTGKQGRDFAAVVSCLDLSHLDLNWQDCVPATESALDWK